MSAMNVLYIKRRSKTPITIQLTGLDLTGCTVYFTAKPEIDTDDTDSNAIIKRDITSHTDAANGVTGFTTTVEETDHEAGRYIADVWVENAAGTAIYGSRNFALEIEESVTRRAVS